MFINTTSHKEQNYIYSYMCLCDSLDNNNFCYLSGANNNKINNISNKVLYVQPNSNIFNHTHIPLQDYIPILYIYGKLQLTIRQ